MSCTSTNRFTTLCSHKSIPMRVLAITNMYPSSETPYAGVFIEQQIKGLRATGVDVQLMVVDRLRQGMKAYLGLGRRVLRRLAAAPVDLIHLTYGGVMAQQVVDAIKDLPLIVTFHGSDLLGQNLSGLMRKWVWAYGVVFLKEAGVKAEGMVAVYKIVSD